MELILLAVGVGIGVVFGLMWARLRAKPAGTADSVTERSELQLAHAAELGALKIELAAATTRAEQLTEQLAAERQTRTELLEQHRIEREQRDAREREEAKVLEKLAPVGDVVNKMQVKLDELKADHGKQNAEIQAQLKTSLDVSSKLTESTQSLARVMSDSSQRGRWGELQLERVAELAGLHKGVNYVLQKSIEGEDSRSRPDMIVYLSGNGAIPVDAKAPFAAYNEAMSGDVSPEQRKALLAKHAKDLRGHITQLAARDYAKNIEGKVDYVVCFVPADSILTAALEADRDLLEYAIDKKVVLTSPTSLVAVLRPVAITWVQVENARQAGEIVEMGRELYRRLAALAGHAAKLGKSLQSATGSYNSFVASLESRVLVQARKFDKLDSGDLPEFDAIDGTVNLFNQQELRGMNAELDQPQLAIGEPVDAEEV